MREQAGRAAVYALVLLLAVLTALWGSFLVPLRVAGVPLPVAVVVAAVANVALGVEGGRLYGRLGAVVPGVVWFAIAGTLQARRPEGDLIVVGSLTGYGFLIVGTLAAAVPIGLTPAASRPAPAPPPS